MNPALKPSSSTLATRWRNGGWSLRAFHWSNAVLLVIVVCFFELRRFRHDNLFDEPAQLAYVLALDFLFIAAMLLMGSLLLRLAQRVATRTLSAVYLCTVILCYVLLISAQVFFLKTGSQLSMELVVYAIEQLVMLKDLLAQQTDVRAIKYFVIFSVLLALLLVASRHWPSRRSQRGLQWIAAVAVFMSLAIIAGARESATYRYKGIFNSAVISRKLPALVQEGKLVPLYRPPRIAAGPVPRQSVFVIVLESFRADLLERTDQYGKPLLPNLQLLSPDFQRFDNTYTTISHTSNALVGIFCGMFAPLELTVRVAESGALRPDCLPELLKPLGYRTGFFQSADGDFEHRSVLVDNMGFEAFSDGQALHRRSGQPLGYLGYDDKAIVPLLEEWLHARQTQAPTVPLFVGVLNSVSHHPYATPGSDCEARSADAWACYLQAVQYVDEYVGDVIAMLKRLNYYDNSLIIITGDHGEAFGEHGLQQHDEVPYEAVLRVPLWVRGLQAGAGGGDIANDSELRQHVDILPTILQTLGVDYAAHLPGRSLRGAGHEEIYTFCWYKPSCMTRVSSNGDKIIVDFDTAFLERYDLKRDPGETMPLLELQIDENQYEIIKPLLTYRERIDSFWRTRDQRVAGQ